LIESDLWKGADDFLVMEEPGTRRRHLIASGIDPKEVRMATRGRKRFWRMSANRLVQYTLNNRWLEDQGVPNLRSLWIRLHVGPGKTTGANV